MTPQPVDVVYALGTGSQHHDMELRYSLRSIEKHLKHYRDVYIVGECPDWVQGVKHLPVPDNGQKEENIKNKILAACAVKSVSEHFLFMNDDHFFVQDVDAPTYPYYHKGILYNTIHNREVHKMGGGYLKSLYNTMYALQFRDLPGTNFDIHTPILYHKTDFRKIMQLFDWDVPNGYVIKSLYCNAKMLQGVLLRDCRVNKPSTLDKLHARIMNRNVFSIGDDGIDDTLIKFLNQLYPNKSRYEK